MKKEQIQEFTRRITQSNRSGLVVVMYDIFFSSLADAVRAQEEKNWAEYKVSLRRADRVLEELMSSLNFSYELAKNLYSIYVFCRESLARAMYKREAEDIRYAKRMMEKLYDGFVKAAAQDDSAPLMSNTQQVYAGYTYGKNDIVETCQDLDASRGFFA